MKTINTRIRSRHMGHSKANQLGGADKDTLLPRPSAPATQLSFHCLRRP